MFVIPNSTRMQGDLKIIRGLIEREGLDGARKRMGDAWQWWLSCKTKAGKPYSKTNTAWLDNAQTGQLPAHIVAKDAQQGADGSFYA